MRGILSISKLFSLLLLLPALLYAQPVAVDTAAATLTWDAPTTNTDGTTITDLAEYNIYAASSVNLTYALIGTVLHPLTTYDASGLTPGLSYTFYVTAVDSSGNESDSSNIAAAFIPASIDVIPSEAVTITACNISLVLSDGTTVVVPCETL